MCAPRQVIDLDSQTDNDDAKVGANSKKAMSERQRELRLLREIYMMMGWSLLSIGKDAGGDKAYQMFATDLWIHPRYDSTLFPLVSGVIITLLRSDPWNCRAH